MANYSTINNTGGSNIDYSQRKEINICGTIPSHGVGIKIGQHAELHRSFSQDDVNTFGKLIGDFNPVHFPAESIGSNNNDDAEEQNNQKIHHHNHTYNDPIVHGMLLSSIFSTIFGTLIPGCLYRSQSLKFHHPVFLDELVHGRVVVSKLRQVNTRRGGGVLCTCDTTIRKSSTHERGYETKTNIMYGEDEEKGKEETIMCISGEAQVWLPRVKISTTK